MSRTDVLLVSLGGTAGLREADRELAASLRRAGASVAEAQAARPREWRTYALLELAWARAARAAARAAIAEHRPRAILYSSTTAALLAPAPGAIRFDAPAAGNRPGRHGIWQRPVERRRFAAAPLLVPWSEGGLAEAPRPHADALVVPVPVEAGRPPVERDVAAVTYGANPAKKGLDRVLAAWAAAKRPGEELVVAGLDEAGWLRAAGRGGAAGRGPVRRGPAGRGPAGRESAGTAAAKGWPAGASGDTGVPQGVRFAGMLPRDEYRALLRRARVFVCAPRREDYGIAQLEALADGCMLVTTPSPGPYAALPVARALDDRLVTHDLTRAIRAALDEPAAGYAERAVAALEPWRPDRVDRVVAEELLPRLQ